MLFYVAVAFADIFPKIEFVELVFSKKEDELRGKALVVLDSLENCFS